MTRWQLAEVGSRFGWAGGPPQLWSAGERVCGLGFVRPEMLLGGRACGRLHAARQRVSGPREAKSIVMYEVHEPACAALPPRANFGSIPSMAPSRRRLHRAFPARFARQWPPPDPLAAPQSAPRCVPLAIARLWAVPSSTTMPPLRCSLVRSSAGQPVHHLQSASPKAISHGHLNRPALASRCRSARVVCQSGDHTTSSPRIPSQASSCPIFAQRSVSGVALRLFLPRLRLSSSNGRRTRRLEASHAVPRVWPGFSSETSP